MEKDYFKDRPTEYISNPDYIKIGMEVYICEKIMQDIATELSDLTRGVVIRKLTNHLHPRGVKCEVKMSNGRKAIGRITYIANGEYILTKDGWMKEDEVNKN